MAVLAECPHCHKKQTVRNKKCDCGADLDKLKRQKEKVKYWINFRMPDGKQRREYVGYSIEEARDADGKRRVQKRENRIFDILPEAKMTFNELAKWYEGIKSVKKLASYDRVQLALKNFNAVFGDVIVNNIKSLDLENYQIQREEQGAAPATIDMEISIAKTMINKAFDNDMVGAHTLKAFRRVKRKLRKGANVRKRTITVEEYKRLIDGEPSYVKDMIVFAYNTGMRLGEVRQLKRSYVDREKMMIRLPAESTKEHKSKRVPINRYAKEVLDRQPVPLLHEFIFTYRNKPITQRNGIRKSFKKACDDAKVACGRKEQAGITFHDIRRTVKTNMLNAGIDKTLRDVILGHSLQGMDAHYISPSDDDLTRAMDQYTAWIVDQFANVDQNVDQATKKGLSIVDNPL